MYRAIHVCLTLCRFQLGKIYACFLLRSGFTRYDVQTVCKRLHQHYMARIIRTSQKKYSRRRMLFLASKNECYLPMLLGFCPIHQNQLRPGSCFRVAETSRIQEADNERRQLNILGRLRDRKSYVLFSTTYLQSCPCSDWLRNRFARFPMASTIRTAR
jgi:hypothetical protein